MVKATTWICVLLVSAATISNSYGGVFKDLVRSALIERRDYTEGEFRGLKIGNDKEQTLKQIENINSDAYIEPIPKAEFDISERDIDRLNEMTDLEGMRVFDYSGFGVNVHFKDHKVSALTGPENYKNALALHVDDSIETVFARLKTVMLQNPRMHLVPIVPLPKGGAFALSRLNYETKSELLQTDAWQFENPREKPHGATYAVYFSDDRLVRIRYSRPRIELP
jgi:hypothetical protein